MSDKPTHEVAVDEFVEADEVYKEMEQKLLSGDLVLELNQNYGQDPATLRSEFLTYMSRLQTALQDRNSKFQNAKSEMRKLVEITPGTERGPDGKSDAKKYGPLLVNSVTSRYFDPARLISVAKEKGFFNDMMALKRMTKEGVMLPVVEETITISYPDMYQWLLERGLEGALKTSYREEDGTPQVKGAKLIAFLGDKVDK